MTNKVYVLAPREEWIVDRFVNEWNADNADITVRNPVDADVIWLMADWCYDQLNRSLLASKKVITTIHHIVPEKFNDRERVRFIVRDQLTTAYHVPNRHTEAFIRPLTSKPIHIIPYWANQRIWRPTGTMRDLRKKHGLPSDGLLVGSFQRDTEGSDLVSPKLEKGPDLLADYLDVLMKDWNLWSRDCGYAALRQPHVVLAGWRRQYLISRFEKSNVRYTYFDRPSQEIINELYQCLDLYPITARYEGGPQSLIECGLLDIQCVSRNIGIADQVLPASAINDNVFLATPTIPDVEVLKLPMGYEPFRKLIVSL